MSRHPFDLLMELDTHHIRLDYAALHLARDVYPLLDVARYVRQLDSLADEVADLRPGLGAVARYEALHEVLVENHGFTGNFDGYYDPDNSHLNRVMDLRRGIPISLAIVWIEVARRLKWPVAGVPLPGHFIVRFDDPERYVLADPYHFGATLNVKDCERLVRERFAGRLRLTDDHLRPVDTRGVLVRMLRNLRNVYLAENNLSRVAGTLQRLAALQPQNGRHLRELAAVCCRQGDVRGACAHLALYLHKQPDAHDSPTVRRHLRRLEAAVRALN